MKNKMKYFKIAVTAFIIFQIVTCSPETPAEKSIRPKGEVLHGVYKSRWHTDFTLIVLPDNKWIFCHQGVCDEGQIHMAADKEVLLKAFFTGPVGQKFYRARRQIPFLHAQHKSDTGRQSDDFLFSTPDPFVEFTHYSHGTFISSYFTMIQPFDMETKSKTE